MPQIVYRSARFNVECVVQNLDDGTSLTREIVRHNGAVVILPLLNDGRVCLLRNFRPAVQQWLWELPAGTLELGEPPADCAPRELQEETGYTASKMTLVHRFCMSPGILDERMHYFVAEGLVAGEHAREVGEQMENHLLSWSQIDSMLRDGQISDAKTLVCLLWFLRYRLHA